MTSIDEHREALSRIEHVGAEVYDLNQEISNNPAVPDEIKQLVRDADCKLTEAFDEYEWLIAHEPDPEDVDVRDEDDGPGERIEVAEWSDIDDVTDRITAQERETIASLINEDRIPDGQVAIWLPEFVRDKDVDPVTGCENLYVGDLEDYSEKAWAFTQDGSEPEYLPKSWTVVFDPVNAGDPIESQQHSLAGWA